MNKVRNISIDLYTAQKWYKGKIKELHELALQSFTKEELEESIMPKTWEEYQSEVNSEDSSLGLSKHQTDIHILHKLLILRDYYRQGWKPAWNITEEIKYCIFYSSGLYVDKFQDTAMLFSFPTESIAKEFLNNFRKDLREIENLL